MLYFKIHPSDDSIISTLSRSFPFADDAYNTKETSLINGKPFLVEASETFDPYDSATQVREPTQDTYDGTTALRHHPVRDKTVEELAAEERATDIAALRNAGKDAVMVLVELVSYQLANSSMGADDFTPDVKQAFLDLKVIADRIKQ